MSRSTASSSAGIEQLARRMAEPARRLRAAAAAVLSRANPPAPLRAARRLAADAVCLELAEPERAAGLADALVQCAVLSLFLARTDACDQGRLAPFGGLGETHLACPAQQRWADTILTALGRPPKGRAALGELMGLLAEAELTGGAATPGDSGGPGAAGRLVHPFYEQFLAHYDSAERRRRGVYATPAAVVGYLTRSAEHVLRTRFGCDDGLARCVASRPPWPLRIVDPACGSGVFLSDVIGRVRRTIAARSGPEAWRASLRPRLVQALVGLEVRPASCAAAQFLLLRDLPGAEDAAERSGGRAGRPPVRLANPLEAAETQQAQWLGFGEGRPPLLAIVGNPPYANFGRLNRSPWIRALLEDYKRGLREKKINLDDDFIKFIRWSQFWIDRAGQGVLAFITNNAYLSGLTHRQMRRSLLESFSEIHLLDLHGGAAGRRGAPPGLRDENLFAIRTPVAIGVFVKRPGTAPPGRVFHAQRWGSRDEKLALLADSHIGATEWTRVRDGSDFCFFTPSEASAERELRSSPRLDQLFTHYVSGVQTKHDALLVAFTREELAGRVRALLRRARAASRSQDPPRGAPATAAGPDPPADRRLTRRAAELSYSETRLQPYLVAPFDRRWVYYEPRLLGRARYAVMRHLLGQGGPALVFMRQSTNAGSYDHVLAVNSLASDRVFYSARGAPFVAPLQLRLGASRQPNLEPAAVKQFASRLRLRFHADGCTEGGDRFDAAAVFHYVYALLHSPTYRARYAPALRIDFPRVPITGDRELFWGLCRAGRRLAAAHLQEAPSERSGSRNFPVAGENLVAPGFPQFDADAAARAADCSDSGRLYINRLQYFEGLGRDVWTFRIGGYPVLPRWFKQRRGRRLIQADMTHVTRTMQAIRETIALMAQIDALIPRWPIPCS